VDSHPVRLAHLVELQPQCVPRNKQTIKKAIKQTIKQTNTTLAEANININVLSI
jgi:hypothetical protein